MGYDTGRWDYINSVSDTMAWDPEFINPNIDAITITYGYMRTYEDRVRRAASYEGPERPFGTMAGRDGAQHPRRLRERRRRQHEEGGGRCGARAARGCERQMGRPLEDGSHRTAGLGEKGEANQLGRKFPPLTHTADDARGLLLLEPAPRSIRGARDLLSVALQYGNAFGQGLQAAALKPADFFGNDDILYLMEDMATGEIRLSILWEWLHKGAELTEDDSAAPLYEEPRRTVLTAEVFRQLLAEEYEKLVNAGDRDVHDDSKTTSLPIAREVVETYVLEETKAPWYIDLLNLNIDNYDLETAQKRIRHYIDTFEKDGTRVTENLDFARAH